MENEELRMKNYGNKMLCILIGLAAAGRFFYRFFVRKRAREFAIFHSQFSIEKALF
ncbi:hypothetical protein [Eubacterium maltosivorans]|uniref:hypothetical protein n=1 Tax=Eubacterium maltosivorans TaxID=2041044 RepID=UPI0015881B2C|nr:hypothetical protein [Eubacterium maltosivorans]